MIITKDIYNKLNTAIIEHFAKAKNNLYTSDEFKDTLKIFVEGEMDRLDTQIKPFKGFKHFTQMSNTVDVSISSNERASNFNHTITLDKKYYVFRKQIRLGFNSIAEECKRLGPLARYPGVHEVLLTSDVLMSGPFKDISRTYKDFEMAENALCAELKNSYIQKSSVEKLLIVFPAFKMFLTKIGVEI